jgi:hypothetical protein
MTAVREPATFRPPTPQADRRIGPWGTLARVLVGTGLIGLAVWMGLRWYDAALGLGVLPGAFTLAVRLRGRHAPALGLDGQLVCLAWGLGAVLFVFLDQPAMLFYGTSMLLAAARGQPGCELFAVPNWILRRHDRLACPLFGPIDAAEARPRTTSRGA